MHLLHAGGSAAAAAAATGNSRPSKGSSQQPFGGRSSDCSIRKLEHQHQLGQSCCVCLFDSRDGRRAAALADSGDEHIRAGRRSEKDVRPARAQV